MFKIVAVLASVPNLMAGFVWIYNPMAVLVLWGIDEPSHGLVVERRLGIVILGVGLMLLLARNAAPSPARSAICYGMIAGASGVIAANLYDLLNGHVSSGVIAGTGINLLTAIAFALVQWHTHRQAKADAKS